MWTRCSQDTNSCRVGGSIGGRKSPNLSRGSDAPVSTAKQFYLSSFQFGRMGKVFLIVHKVLRASSKCASRETRYKHGSKQEA